MISADASVVAGQDTSAALPNQNRAGVDFFPTISLHAQSLRLTITPTTGAAASFLVCHI